MDGWVLNILKKFVTLFKTINVFGDGYIPPLSSDQTTLKIVYGGGQIG
jgi:hypothetical protein